MAFSRTELERIADDQYKDRRIAGAVYCGNCGYNLRTLPYRYNCPECGNDYNARPLTMKGIFQPHEAEIPFGDIASAMLFGVGAVYLFGRAYQLSELPTALFGVVLAAAAVTFFVRACREFGKLLKSRAIAKRIELEEEA